MSGKLQLKNFLEFHFLFIFPMYSNQICQDYENETNWRTKVPQENCGEFAINEPGKKSICKVEPSELFRVKLVIF